VNKYQTLFNNVRTRVLLFPHSTFIVRMLCVFTNYKIIENIDFYPHGEHKKKIIRMYSILFFITLK
jgi:hypothetical protein